MIQQREALEELFKRNNNLHESTECIQMCAEYSTHLIKAMLALYNLSSVAFLSWPLVAFAFTGKFTPFLPNRLPYFDIETTNGFVIHCIFHVYLLCIAGMGLGFIDGIYLIFTLNVLTFSGLVTHQIKRLNQVLATPKHSKAEVRFLFRNIILMHKEMKM